MLLAVLLGQMVASPSPTASTCPPTPVKWITSPEIPSGAYPSFSKRPDLGGTGVEVSVDASGIVTAVRIIKPSGFQNFDAAALAAAAKGTYKPATVGCKPTSGTIDVGFGWGTDY